ncbi:prolyl 4-hydroxylase subunit alpha-2 [Scaptodrosophila lebanonensis]|uniref:procollagen-proline 4-dioxygenase n=1 Tax=Drosophila lebanonensis TaxID=7225 RepID=A0A6J2SZD2_DROLE|nr:prolyl 4-hydroxylase subunit alpha-2 [Scaptodrosophila lebanonensis]
MKMLATLAVLVAVLHCVTAEFYSSTSGLSQLLRTEVVLLAELQNYVNEISQHAEALQSEIDAIKVEHLSAADSIEGYLNNPVNAFRLIKRLHSDWQTFSDSVEREASRTNYLEAMAKHQQNLSFPTHEDFVGSALALTRLQQTYQLDVAELASGILNGIKHGTGMSWQDCFVLGQHLYTMRDYNNTVPWLKQSMQLLATQSYGTESGSLDFMESVAEYHQTLGDYENALDLVNYVLYLVPEERPHLYEKRELLEELIRDGVRHGLLHETVRSPTDYHISQEFRLYEQVCRGELKPSARSQRPLRCRYQSNKVPFRLLQPYKLEELHLDPLIVQAHEVVSARDIRILKRLAGPHIQRSTVYSLEGSEATAAPYRTSQGASFDYTKHRAMWRLSRNVGDLSGLDMRYAEMLQIANYGIGGHFEPHWDSFPEHHTYLENDHDGNRIATGIYYLSDVQEGGGTAFPFLPLLVTPQRGSLLFWYNLHRSGDQDYRTKHAACPVLLGNKWIANVWIRERRQDHVRPCDIYRDNEISLPYRDFN